MFNCYLLGRDTCYSFWALSVKLRAQHGWETLKVTFARSSTSWRAHRIGIRMGFSCLDTVFLKFTSVGFHSL